MNKPEPLQKQVVVLVDRLQKAMRLAATISLILAALMRWLKRKLQNHINYLTK